MKRLAFRLTAIISALLVTAGCAKKESENFEDTERASFEAWIERYAPTAERFGEKMYMERIVTAPPGSPRPTIDDWVMINYTGRTLDNGGDGHVFITRDRETGLIELGAAAVARTHYVPDYCMITSPNRTMIQGQYEALLSMSEGDSVRLYMPSSMAYGSYGSSVSGGYQGQYSLGSNAPLILDLKLQQVIKDPEQREAALVENYAIDELGLMSEDSLRLNLYVKYEPNDLEADSIKEDGTATIEYVGRFLDGFVFDTNVDTVARKLGWGSLYSSPGETEYRPSSGGMIDAFYEVVSNMVYDCKATFVFSSDWGYGAAGSSSGSTVIQSYTPLVFEIYVKSNEQEE